MMCPSCGALVQDGMTYCTNCGANLNQPSTYQSSGSATARKVGFVEAVRLFFENYFNFTGRATKSEYWWAFLFNFVVSFVLGNIPYIGTLLSLVLLIPGLSVCVRRLHDTGKSWVYYLWNLLPLVGSIILIVQLCKDSDGPNQWGPVPQ